MSKKTIWILVIAIAAVFAGMSLFSGKNVTDEITSTDSEDSVMSIKNQSNARMAVLKSVDGSDSSGTAYVFMGDGKLMHLVEANMPEPTVGSVYEGWLVQPTPLRFFSTGVMSKNSEGLWALEFTAGQEYPTYNRVVITEETIVDEKPEKHILQGDF